MTGTHQNPLILYFSPGACSFACHIALEEAGLAFEIVPVNLKGGGQTASSYADINPRGKVPALRIGDAILTEGHAILTYIADQVPDRNLLPSCGDFLRARAHEWMNFTASTLHIAFRPIFRPNAPLYDGIDEDEVRKRALAELGNVLRLVDDALPEQGYCLGDQFSLCDAYLLVFYLWAQSPLIGESAAPGPRFTQLARIVAKRKAVQVAARREGLQHALFA